MKMKLTDAAALLGEPLPAPSGRYTDKQGNCVAGYCMVAGGARCQFPSGEQFAVFLHENCGLPEMVADYFAHQINDLNDAGKEHEAWQMASVAMDHIEVESNEEFPF